MSQIILEGNVAFLPSSGSAVWFSKPSMAAFGGPAAEELKTSEPQLKELVQSHRIAPWGEDNRFPQNIVAQMAYCGVGKSALDFKARVLWGTGLMWGKVIDVDDKGNEIFQPAKPNEYPEVKAWMRDNGMLSRFYAEMMQDWCWFSNTFPEHVLSKDGKNIRRLIHQESCDARFEQMDKRGRINNVILSKLWGTPEEQLVKFKAEASDGPVMHSASSIPSGEADGQYVVTVPCLDPYNALDSLRKLAEAGKRNVIQPVNYPSPNKTYYQLPYWDGARLAGWVEIAAKIPTLMKALYEKSFRIQYHIEVPDSYWPTRYGTNEWEKMSPAEKDTKRIEVLQEMDKFLSGAENAFKTFVSTFSVERHSGKEYGHVKITPIDNKSSIDKDILASAAANSELLFAMQINPDLMGAGTPGASGSVRSSSSGSNIREAFLIYTALLHQERHMLLEPLRLVQQYNGWDPELEFRFRDIVLTTLDKGAGTEKKLS